MQADSHQHDSTNHVDFQPDLSLPSSPKQGFEGGSEVRRPVRGFSCLVSLTQEEGTLISDPNFGKPSFCNNASYYAGFYGGDVDGRSINYQNAFAPASYGIDATHGLGGGLNGFIPLWPDAFASPFQGNNVNPTWGLHGSASLHQNVTFPATYPWSVVSQSSVFNAPPPLPEKDFVYPPLDLGSALVNGHHGSINEQPGMSTLGFGTMYAPNSLEPNFSMPPTPFIIPDAMSNALPNFDISTFHPNLGVSFNSLPVVPIGLPVSETTPPSTTHGRRIPCNFLICNKSFKRAADRKRHEESVHLNVPGIYLCHIPGCPKSHGKGYKRPDKVTEHLWRKHANLGYTKA